MFRFFEISESGRSGPPYDMRDTHSIKWMTHHRDLTAPVSGRGVNPKNEAPLAEISDQKEGRPGGRRVGREFPRTPPISHGAIVGN